MNDQQEQEQLAKIMESITPEDLRDELMEVGNSAAQLKADCLELKRAGRNEELRKIIDRATIIDIPDLIETLATRVAGALAVTYAKVQYELGITGEDDEDDSDDGYEDVDSEIGPEYQHRIEEFYEQARKDRGPLVQAIEIVERSETDPVQKEAIKDTLSRYLQTLDEALKALPQLLGAAPQISAELPTDEGKIDVPAPNIVEPSVQPVSAPDAQEDTQD